MTLVPIVRYFNPTLTINMVGTVVVFANGEGLNVRFNVSRTLASTPDTASVAIEGLDPVRAKLMNLVFASRGLVPVSLAAMTILAGYDATFAGLFRGDLRSFSTGEQEGTSLWTRATADDGGDAYSDATLPSALSSSAGLTAQEMIDTAAAVMKLGQSPSVAIVIAQTVPTKQGRFTAVVVGKASELMDAACRRLRCRWWIRDQQLFLGIRGQVDPSRKAVVLTPATLVAPLSEDGAGLVTLSTFMDPNIVPGGQVLNVPSFERGELPTAFRVEAVVHSGETRGGSPWVSKITGRAL